MALTYDPVNDHEESESNCSLVPFDGATHPGLDGPGIKPGSDLEDSQVHSRGSSIIRLPGPEDSQDREYIIEQVKDAAMIVDPSMLAYPKPQNQWEWLHILEDHPCSPWHSMAEARLVEWLASSDLSQVKINKFLQLEWVRNNIIYIKSLLLTVMGCSTGRPGM